MFLVVLVVTACQIRKKVFNFLGLIERFTFEIYLISTVDFAFRDEAVSHHDRVQS